MKYMGHISLSIAALSIALFLPGSAHAQSDVQSQSEAPSPAGRQQAAQMVPARAYLLNKLNAKSMKTGSQFTARLSEAVQLKNGPELPKGTELIGIVSTDDMQVKGTSRLALRITEAHLKNGETIPVKATIVAVYAPESETVNGYSVAPGEEEANDWTNTFVQVDQPDVEPGFDLHSRVDDDNSGVFVSTRKNNVKIASGSELALAIGAQNGQQSGAAGGN